MLLITVIEKFEVVFEVVELFVLLLLLGLVVFEVDEEFVPVVFEDILL